MLSFVCAYLLSPEHPEGAVGSFEDQGRRGQPGRIPVSDSGLQARETQRREAERLKHGGGIERQGNSSTHRKTGPKEDQEGYYPEPNEECFALLRMKPATGKHPRHPGLCPTTLASFVWSIGLGYALLSEDRGCREVGGPQVFGQVTFE